MDLGAVECYGAEGDWVQSREGLEGQFKSEQVYSQQELSLVLNLSVEFSMVLNLSGLLGLSRVLNLRAGRMPSPEKKQPGGRPWCFLSHSLHLPPLHPVSSAFLGSTVSYLVSVPICLVGKFFL